MTDKMQQSFADGKYTVIYEDGKVTALRYGEPWQDLTGNNLVYWMLVEIDKLRKNPPAPTARTFADWANSLTTEETHQFDAAGRGYKKDVHQMMRLAWDAAQAAPAQRQPLSDAQIAGIATETTGWLNPPPSLFCLVRAIEAAHGITAAPAAQKGEKP